MSDKNTIKIADEANDELSESSDEAIKRDLACELARRICNDMKLSVECRTELEKDLSDNICAFIQKSGENIGEK